ncbi:MAG: tRNA pseudouridine(38-40) synthase TruA [Saprospiraceae bacterium]|nr:tRNA pseudouridine(38-40) synthase TruA [Saprospiraceae bacterium]
MRFFLDLSYWGTNYNGWQNQQKQKNTRCVQRVIEQSIFTLTRTVHELVGCGRTDTGVHAIHYIAHTDSNEELDNPKFLYKLNNILPEDIVIHVIRKTHEKAHARFDALSRSYVYKLHLEKSPFPDLSFLYTYKIPDLEVLNKAVELLLDYRDFNSFCKTRTDVKTTLCNIESAYWIKNDSNEFEFHIKADRFLRGMIRLIVGMCLDVDRNKLTLDDVKKALDKKERLPRNWSVPAIGLFLCDIKYPEEIYKL